MKNYPYKKWQPPLKFTIEKQEKTEINHCIPLQTSQVICRKSLDQTRFGPSRSNVRDQMSGDQTSGDQTRMEIKRLEKK